MITLNDICVGVTLCGLFLYISFREKTKNRFIEKGTWLIIRISLSLLAVGFYIANRFFAFMPELPPFLIMPFLMIFLAGCAYYNYKHDKCF